MKYITEEQLRVLLHKKSEGEISTIAMLEELNNIVDAKSKDSKVITRLIEYLEKRRDSANEAYEKSNLSNLDLSRIAMSFDTCINAIKDYLEEKNTE